MSFGNMTLAMERKQSLLKGIKLKTFDYSQSESVGVRRLYYGEDRALSCL